MERSLEPTRRRISDKKFHSFPVQMRLYERIFTVLQMPPMKTLVPTMKNDELLVIETHDQTHCMVQSRQWFLDQMKDDEDVVKYRRTFAEGKASEFFDVFHEGDYPVLIYKFSHEDFERGLVDA